MLTRIILSSTLAVLTFGISGAAQGPPADYRTYFTFSTPVTLPGGTLPAGRYVFRLADPNGSRKVISILSEDGLTPMAMLHTIPNRLAEAPRDPEIRFMETPADLPPAIKTWWYPGNSTGYEFIYPRTQALQLAAANTEPVLTTAAETGDLKTDELARISASGAPVVVVADADPDPVVAATGRVQRGEVPSGSGAIAASQDTPAAASQSARADIAQNTRPDAAQDTRADGLAARDTERTALPETASLLPTVTLFGTLALLAGIALSLRRRASAFDVR